MSRLFEESFQFLLPRHCYEGFVHLTRHLVFGISGFCITFCSRSFWISSPFCMRKTIIIPQLLTCKEERMKKYGQLRFVFNCLEKNDFLIKSSTICSVFQISDVPCKIKAVYETRFGGT